jgi:hypothetical protein
MTIPEGVKTVNNVWRDECHRGQCQWCAERPAVHMVAIDFENDRPSVLVICDVCAYLARGRMVGDHENH